MASTHVALPCVRRSLAAYGAIYPFKFGVYEGRLHELLSGHQLSVPEFDERRTLSIGSICSNGYPFICTGVTAT